MPEVPEYTKGTRSHLIKCSGIEVAVNELTKELVVTTIQNGTPTPS